MNDIMQEITAAITELREAEHQAIEKACEEALQMGDRGVLVIRDRFGVLVSVSPNSRVPYGQIIEMSKLFGAIDD